MSSPGESREYRALLSLYRRLHVFNICSLSSLDVQFVGLVKFSVILSREIKIIIAVVSAGKIHAQLLSTLASLSLWQDVLLEGYLLYGVSRGTLPSRLPISPTLYGLFRYGCCCCCCCSTHARRISQPLDNVLCEPKWRLSLSLGYNMHCAAVLRDTVYIHI